MPKKNPPPRKTDSSGKNKANSPITGFRISNFKAFADTQYIPIRPLTLIYGANSSGKSSVLHSLLLAHHAITNEGELDVYRTEAGGDSVDLGGFGQYVHKHQRSNVIEWTVDLNPKHLNLQNIEHVLNHPSKHPNTKYIIEKLRLRKVKAAKATILPSSHDEWCQEAVNSHINEPLNAILTSQKTAANFPGIAEVCSIEKLSIARWLQTHSCSIRLKRNIQEYLKYLGVVLNQARMIKFIDPYFDPDPGKSYRDFHHLITAATIDIKEPKKTIEIHLVKKCSEADAKQQFQNLSPVLKNANLTAQVFFWDDFHDRYLITDIIGINLNNGFNTDNKLTTWTKLSKLNRNNINDEFKPDSLRKKSLVGNHLLCYKFSVP